MEDIRSLLPRDKHDMENVEKLKRLDKASLRSILPELFEWIQDINWPIAPELAKILISCGKDIVPELKKALESGDDDWKFACFGWIITELPRDIIKELAPELKRIAYQPSSTERNSELDDNAKEILKTLAII
ncbi:DUF5071 domain-containing protein [Brevibacillus sp. HB2.2]|uniref:DUF5071 domain-containing protein n=1 Tax=Brevibacillus sp. HB2.2 TaxID=2738846 RepID=UPI00156B7F02|nr:DUF5071 domain-containing protein [Brevibacillus sp. HB2.2]NRS47940.1 DUF5071 domain-containing protein [Brevibacillus sp. HB2.2]